MTTALNDADKISEHLLEELRQLKADSGTNKHEQAANLIIACILNEIDTYQLILEALTRLGFRWEHISIILREELKEVPQKRRWQMGLDRRFRLQEWVL